MGFLESYSGTPMGSVQNTGGIGNTASTNQIQSTIGPGGLLGYGSGGVSQPTTYTDSMGNHYSSAGAASAANQKIDMAKAAQQGIIAGGKVAVNSLEQQYQDKTLPFARQVEQGQQGINQGEAQNALNLRRSNTSIGQGVRQGIRSVGVSLANKNALSSGAAPAAAEAWAKQGGLQLNQARNQSALESQKLDTTQTNLNQTKEDTLASLLRFKVTESDRIYHDVMQRLNDLNAYTGVGGVVDTHGQDAIVNDALHRLDQLDIALQQRLAAAHGLTPDEINAKAAEMDVAGAAANPFAVDQPNVQTPGGPPQTQIPFLLAKPKDEVPINQPLAVA